MHTRLRHLLLLIPNQRSRLTCATTALQVLNFYGGVPIAPHSMLKSTGTSVITETTAATAAQFVEVSVAILEVAHRVQVVQSQADPKLAPSPLATPAQAPIFEWR